MGHVLRAVPLEQSFGSSRKAVASGSLGPTGTWAQLLMPHELRIVSCHVFSPLHSGKNRMYDVIQETIENDFPTFLGKIFAFLANPGLIIPAILLML